MSIFFVFLVDSPAVHPERFALLAQILRMHFALVAHVQTVRFLQRALKKHNVPLSPATATHQRRKTTHSRQQARHLRDGWERHEGNLKAARYSDSHVLAAMAMTTQAKESATEHLPPPDTTWEANMGNDETNDRS